MPPGAGAPRRGRGPRRRRRSCRTRSRAAARRRRRPGRRPASRRGRPGRARTASSWNRATPSRPPTTKPVDGDRAMLGDREADGLATRQPQRPQPGDLDRPGDPRQGERRRDAERGVGGRHQGGRQDEPPDRLGHGRRADRGRLPPPGSWWSRPATSRSRPPAGRPAPSWARRRWSRSAPGAPPGAWARNHSRGASTQDRPRGSPANPSRTSATRYWSVKPCDARRERLAELHAARRLRERSSR